MCFLGFLFSFDFIVALTTEDRLHQSSSNGIHDVTHSAKDGFQNIARRSRCRICTCGSSICSSTSRTCSSSCCTRSCRSRCTTRSNSRNSRRIKCCRSTLTICSFDNLSPVERINARRHGGICNLCISNLTILSVRRPWVVDKDVTGTIQTSSEHAVCTTIRVTVVIHVSGTLIAVHHNHLTLFQGLDNLRKNTSRRRHDSLTASSRKSCNLQTQLVERCRADVTVAILCIECTRINRLTKHCRSTHSSRGHNTSGVLNIRAIPTQSIATPSRIVLCEVVRTMLNGCTIILHHIRLCTCIRGSNCSSITCRSSSSNSTTQSLHRVSMSSSILKHTR